MVHAVFGYTLAVAGIARIIEVCFIAHKDTTPGTWGDDADNTDPRGTPTSGGISPLRAFRYLPPFVSRLVPFASQPESDAGCLVPRRGWSIIHVRN